MKKTKRMQLKSCIALCIIVALCGCGKKDAKSSSESMFEYSEGPEETGQSDAEAASEASSQSSEDAASEPSEDAVSEPSEEFSDRPADRSSVESTEAGILTDPSDIDLRDTDGNGRNYEFSYDGESFTAIYTTDNWKVIDSYRITGKSDLVIICRALSDEHPVHGSDMESYRTPEDMAYEWQIHSMAYLLLPDEDPLKSHAKDVDLDPRDQGRSLEEIYKDRTGKELDYSKLFTGK